MGHYHYRRLIVPSPPRAAASEAAPGFLERLQGLNNALKANIRRQPLRALGIACVSGALLSCAAAVFLGARRQLQRRP